MTTSTALQTTCPHCGQIHQTTCHRIRRVEYFPDGRVKAVEFHAPQPIVSWGTDQFPRMQQERETK